MSRRAVRCGGYQASGQLIANSLPRPLHGPLHLIRLGEGGGEGLFHDDVHAKGRDLLGPLPVFSSGRAQQDDVRLGLLQTRPVVAENPVGRNGKIRARLLHALGLLVADADDLDICVLKGHAQIVAHVQMVEVDPGDFPLAHGLARKLCPSGYMGRQSKRTFRRYHFLPNPLG